MMINNLAKILSAATILTLTVSFAPQSVLAGLGRHPGSAVYSGSSDPKVRPCRKVSKPSPVYNNSAEPSPGYEDSGGRVLTQCRNNEQKPPSRNRPRKSQPPIQRRFESR